jgi:formamidase
MEAARTVPPRQHGGNCDIKNLTKESKVYFPVDVNGGGLSVVDIYFSQEDGEVSFCAAIEMAGYLDLRENVIKGGHGQVRILNPIFEVISMQPGYSTTPYSEVFPSTSRASSTTSTRTSRIGSRVPTRSST